jgi:hypothetical protein
MSRPIPKKWLEPFRFREELGALDYEVAFTTLSKGDSAASDLGE